MVSISDHLNSLNRQNALTNVIADVLIRVMPEREKSALRVIPPDIHSEDWPGLSDWIDELPPLTLSVADLRQVGVGEDVIADLTLEKLQLLADRVQQHLVLQLIWDEVRFQVDEL